MSLTESWALHGLKGLVPTGSAPHRLLSAFRHTKKSGDSTALTTLVQQIRQDEGHGALTCLATGQLIASLRPAVAAVGLERLKQQELPREILSLLEEPCVIGNLLRRSVIMLRNLSQDEVTLLTTFAQGSDVSITQDDANSQVYDVRPIIAVIRNHPSEDPNEILRQIFTMAWTFQGYALVKKHLTDWQVHPPASPKNPVRTVSDKKKIGDSDRGYQGAVGRFNRRLEDLDIPDSLETQSRIGLKNESKQPQ